mmetsp:Transcript_14312/g.24565  ORF Transcript_14312/g.24565 Transcript_14312/m.24565 type:complete len:249 (-) Transcript_14312:415-1161(-)
MRCLRTPSPVKSQHPHPHDPPHRFSHSSFLATSTRGSVSVHDLDRPKHKAERYTQAPPQRSWDSRYHLHPMEAVPGHAHRGHPAPEPPSARSPLPLHRFRPLLRLVDTTATHRHLLHRRGTALPRQSRHISAFLPIRARLGEASRDAKAFPNSNGSVPSLNARPAAHPSPDTQPLGDPTSHAQRQALEYVATSCRLPCHNQVLHRYGSTLHAGGIHLLPQTSPMPSLQRRARWGWANTSSHRLTRSGA